MASCICVNAKSDIKVTLDGNEVYFPDVKPFIDERDRVLVPIRFVSEALGALVDWENESQTAVIKQDTDEIRYPENTVPAVRGSIGGAEPFRLRQRSECQAG